MQNLMMFVFDDPVPFPRSEYGGLWVVRATHGLEAAELAHAYNDHCTVEEYLLAVHRGHCSLLKTFPEDRPEVLRAFLT